MNIQLVLKSLNHKLFNKENLKLFNISLNHIYSEFVLSHLKHELRSHWS